MKEEYVAEEKGIQRKINDVVDLVEKMKLEFTYLKDMLEILSIGFSYDQYAGQRREASCMNVISRYLAKIEGEELSALSELLDGMEVTE